MMDKFVDYFSYLSRKEIAKDKFKREKEETYIKKAENGPKRSQRDLRVPQVGKLK